MGHYEAFSDAGPETIWPLLACPPRWHEWTPHVRGAWGLGWPQVREGAVGAVRLLGVVPVPAQITAVDPGRSWSWRVAGLASVEHLVEPTPGGSRVTMTLDAPGPLGRALDAAYGPVVQALTEHLARVAEDEAADGM